MAQPKRKAAARLLWENAPTAKSPQPPESGLRHSRKAALAPASKPSQAAQEAQDAKRPPRRAPPQPASRTNIISSSQVSPLQFKTKMEARHESESLYITRILPRTPPYGTPHTRTTQI